MPSPKKPRKPKKPAAPVPAPEPVPSVIDSLLATLARREEAYRAARSAGKEDRAHDLVSCLNSIGARGAEAAPALSVLAQFLAHPGSYEVPEKVIYWDWTMDDNCKEVQPGYLVHVSDAAANAMGKIGPAALPWVEELCRSGAPRARHWALYYLARAADTSAAPRVEELVRAELTRPDSLNTGVMAETVCHCRLKADPTPAAALALIGDPAPLVAMAALDLTYNGWRDLLPADQLRANGDQFRAALRARFDDPDTRIVSKAVAALVHPDLLSHAVQRDVSRLRKHPDPSVRQQVGNVMARLGSLVQPNGYRA